MNTGRVLLVVVTLVLGGCSELPAGPRSVEQLVPTPPSPAPSQAEGITTREQVLRNTGEAEQPAPQLTPEERERLIQGTRREAPSAPNSDSNRPSPPAQ